MAEITLDPTKSIPEFYAGQSIFLTGATGFLGKVFIEKVLRSCPDVREIFLLIRPKAGQSMSERLEKILNLPLYDRLREERPSSFEKLIPISGDTSQKILGLSPVDRQMLLERVTIVVHGAASVRFNDNLTYAVLANTRSTRDICILAQSMKNLVALVYISTAFTQTNNRVIEERAYPPVTDWRKMIEMAESLDEHTLNIFAIKYLDSVPNTYIFSKNLAESIIQEYSTSFPTAILRPSMVLPTVKDPFPGWVDNLYGPIGLAVGVGKGLMKVLYTKKDCRIDTVPVDAVIRSLILAIWKLGSTTCISNSTSLVINCVNGGMKTKTHGNFHRMLKDASKEIPFEGAIWIPADMITTNSYIVYYVSALLVHMLPAILIDQILKLTGRQPMIVKLQRRAFIVSYIMKFYMSNEWKFHDTECRALNHSILPDEQETFSSDMSKDDEIKYFINSAIGAKKFLLHEDMNRLDKVRTYHRRLYLTIRTMQTIIVLVILWMLCK